MRKIFYVIDFILNENGFKGNFREAVEERIKELFALNKDFKNELQKKLVDINIEPNSLTNIPTKLNQDYRK